MGAKQGCPGCTLFDGNNIEVAVTSSPRPVLQDEAMMKRVDTSETSADNTTEAPAATRSQTGPADEPPPSTANIAGAAPASVCNTDGPSAKDDPKHAVLEGLTGKWVRTTDRAYMGEVIRGYIHWAPRYSHPPSALTVTDAGEVAVTLTGYTHTGSLEQASTSGTWAGRLLWSDGEVWQRTVG